MLHKDRFHDTHVAITIIAAAITVTLALVAICLREQWRQWILYRRNWRSVTGSEGTNDDQPAAEETAENA